MPMNITWTFSPGAIIFASRFNQNFSDVKNWADAHEIATTGVHGAGAGQLVSTAANNAFTGTNNFSGFTSFGNAVDLRSPNYISNARFNLTAGVLRLQNEDGLVPSPTRPVYIRRLDTNGNWVTSTFTSVDYCLIQDSASADSYFLDAGTGTPWGTTATVAWGSNMPLFVYMATDSAGSTPCLFLSRKPNLTSLTGPTGIGYANNPPATPNELNVFAWTTNDVTTSHAGRPCTFVGFVEAVKTAGDDWTIQTLSDIKGGVLNYAFENKTYTMPISQNGADVGSYFSAGAGTAPTYTSSNIYTYKIDRRGAVSARFDFRNTVGGTAGAGAFPLVLSLPLAIVSDSNFPTGYAQIINNVTTSMGLVVPSGGIRFDTTTGPATILGSGQNNATRSIIGNFNS